MTARASSGQREFRSAMRDVYAAFCANTQGKMACKFLLRKLMVPATGSETVRRGFPQLLKLNCVLGLSAIPAAVAVSAILPKAAAVASEPKDHEAKLCCRIGCCMRPTSWVT